MLYILAIVETNQWKRGVIAARFHAEGATMKTRLPMLGGS
jgi:hypothetical protein